MTDTSTDNKGRLKLAARELTLRYTFMTSSQIENGGSTVTI